MKENGEERRAAHYEAVIAEAQKIIDACQERLATLGDGYADDEVDNGELSRRMHRAQVLWWPQTQSDFEEGLRSFGLHLDSVAWIMDKARSPRDLGALYVFLRNWRLWLDRNRVSRAQETELAGRCRNKEVRADPGLLRRAQDAAESAIPSLRALSVHCARISELDGWLPIQNERSGISEMVERVQALAEQLTPPPRAAGAKRTLPDYEVLCVADRHGRISRERQLVQALTALLCQLQPRIWREGARRRAARVLKEVGESANPGKTHKGSGKNRH